MSPGYAAGVFALLLACAEPTSPAEPDSLASQDSDDLWELPEPSPRWTAEEAALQIEQALAPGVPVPSQLVNALDEVIRTHGDSGCPGDEFALSGTFEGCTSRSGWTFAGVLEYAGEPPPIEAGEELDLLCDGFVLSPAGERFALAGELEVVEGRVEAEGTWSWPLAESAWLSAGYSGATALSSTSEGLRSWSGSLRLGDLSPVYAQLEEAEAGCPLGEIRLRQEDGYWTTLQVQDCSGCGPVSFEGQELGQACLTGLGSFLDGQADL